MKSYMIKNNKKVVLLEILCLLLLTLHIIEKYILPQLLFINADFFEAFNVCFWWVDISVGNIFRYLAVILFFQIIRSMILLSRENCSKEEITDVEGNEN